MVLYRTSGTFIIKGRYNNNAVLRILQLKRKRKNSCFRKDASHDARKKGQCAASGNQIHQKKFPN